MTKDRKVDFMIMGAAKSGTTTLYGYLAEHSGIFMSALKEPCYFDNTMKHGIEPTKGWHLGEDWYHSLFADAKQGQLLGEASTNYTRYPKVRGVPKRIHDYNPNMKLIYVLRDPVARTYSHYQHRCLRELKLKPPFTRSICEHVVVDPICIDSSKYAMQLDQYHACFDASAILLVSFSELKNQPEAVVKTVIEFLGLQHEPGVLQQSLDRNDAQRFQSLAQMGAVRDRYRSNPVLRAIAKFVPRSWNKRVLYDLMAKLPSNKKLTDQLEPPVLTDAEKKVLTKMLKDDVKRLQETYQFIDESWEDYS